MVRCVRSKSATLNCHMADRAVDRLRIPRVLISVEFYSQALRDTASRAGVGACVGISISQRASVSTRETNCSRTRALDDKGNSVCGRDGWIRELELERRGESSIDDLRSGKPSGPGLIADTGRYPQDGVGLCGRDEVGVAIHGDARLVLTKIRGVIGSDGTRRGGGGGTWALATLFGPTTVKAATADKIISLAKRAFMNPSFGVSVGLISPDWV